MAVTSEVVARFTADIGDVQSKMRVASGAFSAVGEAATFSSRRIAEVGRTMSDVGAKMTVGITLPLGAVALAATNAAMSFESSMTKIVGLVGIATDEVDRMGDSVLTMASRVGKSPDELAAGLFVVTSAGLRGAEAMSALQQAARAGAAGLGETNDIARAVAGALSAYGSETLSASAATDAIVATARAGNFETSQFAAAIGRVLPFAQQAGASFQEMGGAVALLTRVNGDAAQSITQIQALFRAFVVPTEEAKNALAEMGLSAEDLRDSIAEKGLPKTLEMLDRRLGGNREQLGRLLGSSEAASAAFQILEADAQTINDTFGVVADSSGMTAEAFQAVAGTAQFQVSQSMAELKALLIDLGEQFLPLIKSVMDFMQANLRAFNSLPGPVKSTITVFAGLLAALGPILFIVGKLVVVFSTLLSFMLKTRAVGAMRAAFMGLRGEMTAARASMAQTQTRIGMLGTAAKTARLAVVTSFKAIGAAAKTLIASLGPIGIALAAVGGIFEIFVGKAAGVENAIANLRDELDLTTGALTEAGRAWIANELRTNISREDLEMLKQYGITIPEFIAALEQGGAAAEAMQAKIDAMVQGQSDSFGEWVGSSRTSALTIGRTLSGMMEHYDAVKLSAEDLADSQADAAVITSDAQRGLSAEYRRTAQEKLAADRNMTDSQKALDSALDAGVEAVEALQEAFQKMNDVISNEASRDAAIRGVKDLEKSLKENGKAIEGTSNKALDNRAAIRAAAQQWIDYAARAKDTEVAQRRLEKGQEAIRKALKAKGIDPKDSDIFKVFKKQQEESQTTVDEFAKQREVASQYGNDVGRNFIDGILAELARRKKEVENAAADVTSGLSTGGNAGIDAESPSKDAMKVAGNFIDGIIVGVQSRAADVRATMSKSAREFVKAFMGVFAPKEMGPAQSALVGAITAAEDRLKEARQRVKDANKAVKEAEKALADARKDGDAKDITRAEKDLARARKEAAAAADDAKANEWVKKNEKGLAALTKIVKRYDQINAAIAATESALAGLTDLAAKPFGLESGIFKMFSSDVDMDAVARNFATVSQMVREAYGALTDPAVVGKKQARANRREMNKNLAEIESLAAQAIELRKEYEANLQEIATLQETFKADETKLQEALDKANEALDEANAELKALTDERESFLNGISNGFMSFVNNFSEAARSGGKTLVRETRRLANGVAVVIEREMDAPMGAAGIRESLESRLSEVRAFSANIRTLMARGLDPTIVKDFVTSGVANAGDAAAALVAGSDADIQAINQIQHELTREISGFQDYASAQWYDAAVAQKEAIIGPLEEARDEADKALALAREIFDAEMKRLEEANRALMTRMDELSTQIEAIVINLANTLPVRTNQAGQDAIEKMLDGFKSRFPKLYRELNSLMSSLAASMNRVATITVRTVYAKAPKPAGKRAMGGPVLADRAYLVGERGPELFIPGMYGNILPNSLISSVPDMSRKGAGAGGGTVVNVTVNAGMGANGSEIGRQIVQEIKRFERTNGPVFVSA